MEYYPQYYPYEELCKTGRQIIETKDLDNSNIDIHFYSINCIFLALFSDLCI